MAAERETTTEPGDADPGSSLPAAVALEIRFLHSLMEHLPDRIYFKDLQSRFLFGNRSFARFFDLEEPSSIYGKTDFDFFSEFHARAAFEDEQEIIRTGTPRLNLEEMETWPDGRVTWCSTSKAAFRDEQGRIIGTLGISRDITIRKNAQEALRESEARSRQISQELAAANEQLAKANLALEEMSLTDPLTGLRNRRFLASHMPEDIAHVERSHRDAAGQRLDRLAQNIDLLFLMVDLDHFKAVNDVHGHLAGDLVLRQVAQILQLASRGTDTVARMGGEEFLIVARQTARADAHILAERIRAAVATHPFFIGKEDPIHCTCSVGLAAYPLLPDDLAFFPWERTVAIADQCLYAAKHSGRNAWVGIIPDEGTAGLQGRELPGDLAALVRSGLLPVVTSLQGPVQWSPDHG
jgi:diguanylate cyclase (GGDEF)-like protein/PAS domain S-box-containing protein